MQAKYLTTGIVRESRVEAREFDGVICLGDILDFAPHPTESPEGSVIDTLGEGVREAYRKGVRGEIVEAIRTVEREDGAAVAKSRYREFFDGAEGDLYVLAGNQDFPDVLRNVVREYPGVHPADDLSWATAVDGVVPEHAGLPPGVFPGEVSRSAFGESIAEGDGDVLFAHRLPEGFDPGEWGFERAIAAHHGEQTRIGSQNVRVAPYGTGDEVVVEVDSGRVTVSAF